MYTLHITRKIFWATPEGDTITEEEFKRIQQEVNDPYFQFEKDNIYVINPNDEYIEKMARVAQKLAANVQGDDGELYADYTEVHSPLKSDYRKLRKANLPNGFPVIDDINREAKVATKMEVLDLGQTTYQDPQAIEAYIKPYIEKLDNLPRIIWNGYNLTKGKDFIDTHLEIAIPKGKVTPAQREKLYELQDDAGEKGVHLVIAEVE
jgi:hypothetical protein